MTTNVLWLPQLSANFEISNNSDWLDSLFFGAPGAASINLTAAIASGSSNLTVASTAGIVVGQPISQVLGIPAGAYVGAVSSPTVFTMVDQNNAAVTATLTDTAVSITLMPLPLNITGIAFLAQLRQRAGGTEVFMTVQTSDGSFVNGGKTGLLAFNVLATEVQQDLDPGSYVMDVLAIADGHTINVFSQGPATVKVNAGVTVPPS